MKDPHDLIQELKDQDWTREGMGKDEHGTPIYMMIAPDGRRCNLLWADLDLLDRRGKLNVVGVDELHAEK